MALRENMPSVGRRESASPYLKNMADILQNRRANAQTALNAENLETLRSKQLAQTDAAATALGLQRGVVNEQNALQLKQNQENMLRDDARAAAAVEYAKGAPARAIAEEDAKIKRDRAARIKMTEEAAAAGVIPGYKGLTAEESKKVRNTPRFQNLTRTNPHQDGISGQQKELNSLNAMLTDPAKRSLTDDPAIIQRQIEAYGDSKGWSNEEKSYAVQQQLRNYPVASDAQAAAQREMAIENQKQVAGLIKSGLGSGTSKGIDSNGNFTKDMSVSDQSKIFDHLSKVIERQGGDIAPQGVLSELTDFTVGWDEISPRANNLTLATAEPVLAAMRELGGGNDITNFEKLVRSGAIVGNTWKIDYKKLLSNPEALNKVLATGGGSNTGNYPMGNAMGSLVDSQKILQKNLGNINKSTIPQKNNRMQTIFSQLTNDPYITEQKPVPKVPVPKVTASESSNTGTGGVGSVLSSLTKSPESAVATPVDIKPFERAAPASIFQSTRNRMNEHLNAIDDDSYKVSADQANVIKHNKETNFRDVQTRSRSHKALADALTQSRDVEYIQSAYDNYLRHIPKKIFKGSGSQISDTLQSDPLIAKAKKLLAELESN